MNYTLGNFYRSKEWCSFRELLINERSVREDHEAAVAVLLAESDDVLLADHRLTACHDVCVDAEFLALCDEAVHILKCQIKSTAVFGSPAALAVKVACGSGVKQNDPRHAAAKLLGSLSCLMESGESAFETD